MTSGTGAVGAPPVDIIPLGGVGEFGMNMLLVACGDTALLVDAGVMFPGPELFGVDLIIPDVGALSAYRGRITRARAHARSRRSHRRRPARDPVRRRSDLRLAADAGARPAEAGRTRDRCRRSTDCGRAATDVDVGPLRLEFLRVTHSIPDCLAVAIHTPAGVILHTGDFKIDQTPLDGQLFDLHRFAELGSQGVLALLSDSTNADRPGFTGSEREVIEGFEEVFSSADGKIVVAAFSTSVYRLQLIVNLADQFDRKVAFVGRGMQQTSVIAERLGYLQIPPGVPDPRQRRRGL